MRAGTTALTFDDGPHPQGTPAVLDELDRWGWPATFFVLGAQARRHPDLVAEIARRGHEVGVHGDRHDYLIARWPRAAARDLRLARDTVGDLLGRPPLWWRPPYGVLSGPSLVAARRLALRPLLWSAWGRDWRADATPVSVVGDLARGRIDGGTLLLHDSDLMSAAGSWRTTVAALEPLHDLLAGAGVEVRPLTR
jgi:peptidoglycan/xylan/chitin deacetylase (PgdA/CDA1 family)